MSYSLGLGFSYDTYMTIHATVRIVETYIFHDASIYGPLPIDVGIILKRVLELLVLI